MSHGDRFLDSFSAGLFENTSGYTVNSYLLTFGKRKKTAYLLILFRTENIINKMVRKH